MKGSQHEEKDVRRGRKRSRNEEREERRKKNYRGGQKEK